MSESMQDTSIQIGNFSRALISTKIATHLVERTPDCEQARFILYTSLDAIIHCVNLVRP